jgi:hypothetical protein
MTWQPPPSAEFFLFFPLFFSFRAAPPQGGDPEEKEERRRSQLDPEKRKKGEEDLAKEHGANIEKGEGGGNADEGLLPGEPDGERHGGQLGLVAQFGKEYYAECGNKNGVIHKLSRIFRRWYWIHLGKARQDFPWQTERTLIQILLTPGELSTSTM